MWQDITLTVLNMLFAYSLIPQVYHGFKNKRGYIILQTSLITASAMCIQTVVFFTLKLFFATIMSGVIAILWALLMTQRLIYKDKS